MKKEPKYFAVLRYIETQNGRGRMPGYSVLATIILWQAARRNKSVINYMVCVYMGKLQKRGWVDSVYEKHRWKGYRVTTEGKKIIN